MTDGRLDSVVGMSMLQLLQVSYNFWCSHFALQRPWSHAAILLDVPVSLQHAAIVRCGLQS